MKIDLSEIARTPGMHATQEIDEPCPDDMGVTCTVPIKGQVSFTNTGSLLILKGEVCTEVRLECGRCLSEFQYPIAAEIQEEYRLQRIGDAIRVYPLDEDDAVSNLVVNNVLDLDELIRQSVLIAIPIQPLCKADCKGLCPSCGQNLNMGKCICLRDNVDTPFKALAELMRENDEPEQKDEQSNE